MRTIVITLIRFYRIFISPLFPSSCRFYPTCSQYALDALNTYGLLKGGWLALKRLVRCHPFCPGGYDPVDPESRSAKPARESGKAGFPESRTV